MYERECIAQEFYIEEHAIMYALLVKHAQGMFGEKGLDASVDGTILYAQERGHRMALRAVADGRPLTPNNYLLYAEWDDHLSWNKGKTLETTPVYHTLSLSCGWCECWKKHGLMQYGKHYCTYIDRNLVKGFNPQNELELPKILSAGDDCCDFHWIGADFPTEDSLQKQASDRSEIKDRIIKDFLYHTAHLYSAMKRAYVAALGEKDASIVCMAALDAFESKFSYEKKKAILLEYTQDFSVV